MIISQSVSDLPTSKNKNKMAAICRHAPFSCAVFAAEVGEEGESQK